MELTQNPSVLELVRKTAELTTPKEIVWIDGCGVTVETLRQLLTLDAESWRENCAGIREYFAQFGDKLPHELRDELEALEKAFAE